MSGEHLQDHWSSGLFLYPKFKPLGSCFCKDMFVSDLVGNPKDMVSREGAHMTLT